MLCHTSAQTASGVDRCTACKWQTALLAGWVLPKEKGDGSGAARIERRLGLRKMVTSAGTAVAVSGCLLMESELYSSKLVGRMDERMRLWKSRAMDVSRQARPGARPNLEWREQRQKRGGYPHFLFDPRARRHAATRFGIGSTSPTDFERLDYTVWKTRSQSYGCRSRVVLGATQRKESLGGSSGQWSRAFEERVARVFSTESHLSSVSSILKRLKPQSSFFAGQSLLDICATCETFNFIYDLYHPANIWTKEPCQRPYTPRTPCHPSSDFLPLLSVSKHSRFMRHLINVISTDCAFVCPPFYRTLAHI